MSNFVINPHSFTAPVVCQEANGSDDNYLGQGTGVGTIERLAVVVGSGNSFIGKTVSELQFPLRTRHGVGTISGNIICNVYDSDYTTVLATSSTVDSTELTTDWVNQTFTFASSITITEGKYYALLGSGANNWGDTDNEVEPYFSSDESITGNTSSWYTDTSGKVDKTKTMSWCV